MLDNLGYCVDTRNSVWEIELDYNYISMGLILQCGPCQWCLLVCKPIYIYIYSYIYVQTPSSGMGPVRRCASQLEP